MKELLSNENYTYNVLYYSSCAVIKHQINHISTAWISDFFRKPQKRLQPTTLIIAAEVFVGIENYSSGDGNVT